MARKPIVDMSAWPSLSLEGNLIAPAMVAAADRREASEQTETDYRIRKGLTIREEISTAFRVGQSHFDTFAKVANPSADATRRFIKAFLQETFGFDDLVPADVSLSFIAGGRVPIVVVPPSDEKLDRRSATLSTDRTRSPAFALQDHLNEHDETLWGLVTNGTLIRLMRDNASLTRPAYIEADLSQIFTNEDAASFAVLWLLIHRTRFGVTGAPATDCALERWRDAGSKEGEVARDRLAVQVQLALKVLGSGFLEANPDLRDKLKSGEVNLTEWFNELLRLVYRLIFLMVAEDRNLLHPEKAKPEARKLYAEGYSLAALRAQCYRAASWDKHHDRYEGIKIVFHALAHGQDPLALPALGGLFSDDKLPHLETARLRNRAFMEALYRLSWLDQKTGMVPVNWRAMETEELGSVYESLLELQPQLGDDGKTLVFASEAAEQKGNQRKTTGSYYTPDSLVQALLDTALDPVLDKTEAEADDPAKALLKLSVIDPACGSGHFLLAAARRIATRLARIRADGTPALSDFRHALRDVARSCLHGVDRNPMAVELTKVALWIETVDPGLPLGFFDAQIRCGDALLGVFDLKVLQEGIPDAAYKPLTGDDKEAAKYYARANKDAKAGQGRLDFTGGRSRLPAIRPIATEYTGFRALGEDTLDDIITKDRHFRSLREGEAFHKVEMACDLYIAAFLLPKTGGAPISRGTRTIPTTSDVWQALDDGEVWGPLIGQAQAARRARAFHWPLEFPDVMLRSGFDIVLGNPPWERIKLQEQEFFAALSPEIVSAPNKTARDRLIKALEAEAEGSPGRLLHGSFVAAKRDAEATSEFVRVSEHEGGRFALTGRGDVNTYALFAELFSCLVAPNGRGGVVIPSAIATDSTTAPFFAKLVSNRQIVELHDFQTGKGFFDAIGHARFKFSLVTLCASGRGPDEIPLSFFSRTLEEYCNPQRRILLSTDEIFAINPNTRTLAVFRTQDDARLTAKIYSNASVLVSEGNGEAENPWGLGFMSMFHMSSDSPLFQTAAQLREQGFVRKGVNWLDPSSDKNLYIPLLEAKLCNLWDHRASSYTVRGEERGYRVLPETELHEHTNPAFEVEPFYWVAQEEVKKRLASRTYQRSWFIGIRDITSATNERTAIVTLVPAIGVGNSLSLMLIEGPQFSKSGCLLANLSSLVFDYVARQKVGGTHLNIFILKQLPVLPPDFYTASRLSFVTQKALELTYTSQSTAPFAADLGYVGAPFAWDEDRRAHLRADLEAFYARAYGLTREELRYILDPAEVKGPDYPSETFRGMMEKEIRLHGEYRTRRLVLAAWDRMETEGEFAALGMAGTTSSAVQPTKLPPLDQFQNAVWAWPQGINERDRVRAQLRAMVGILPGPSDIRRVRLAALACLQPGLLDGFLSEADRREWRRLMAHSTRVTQLVPPTNAAWGAAFNELVSSAVLDVSSDGARWGAGSRLDRSTLNANDPAVGRALFAWSKLQGVNLDQGLAQVSAEILPFIREGRLAA